MKNREGAVQQRRLRIAAIGLRGVPCHYSGLETAAESVYRALALRGHEITVYSRPRYLETEECDYEGIRLVRVPSVNLRSVETLSHVATSLVHALARGEYDLLHLHALAPGLLAWVRRWSRVPIVATIQGLDWQRAKWRGVGSRVLRLAERLLVSYADELIVVSRDLQRYFERRYSRSSEYIPNALSPLQAPICPALLQHFGIEPGRYVLYAGRLVPEKRVEDLILAFRDVPEQFRLVLAGEGGYTDGYVRYLRDLASGDPRILFAGLLRGTALSTVFSQATVFVLPSTLEGLPMALLECLGCGVPAIVSDIPPHRELLESLDGYDLFFPSGDPETLAACLGRFFAAEERYRSLARHAQEHVRSRHDWRRIASCTERVFLRAVHRAAGPPSRSSETRIQKTA